ncbi:adenosine deaminase [Nocardioides phosphati]|uniref:Adenosine deaminase n=1 Tax=Nocardioides phosphati TaxID=1867775 RepID=A0ABQ2N4Q6_9ACTN|nr:adenosine deaminase [Nocardioides phosphati]GGO84506.1 adenosine deaminase [Nocardioides phosphati]
MTAVLTFDEIRALPKVVLHDHLDGGLRPATIIDIATEIGHPLPTADPVALGEWFRDNATSGSLVRYLEGFEHTIAVMQTPDHLRRIAREAVEDLVDDGVVYAELRYAPELFVQQGMTMDEVVGAVQEGLDAGVADAAAAGRPIVVRQLLTAMRQAARGIEVARLAVAWRDRGVAGFDIAGPEDGFPPTRFLDAFEYLAQENMRISIHAGEAFGLPSIWEAVHPCGADRLGHGVRIIEDVSFSDDGAALGTLAAYVRDRRIPLEICPTSNVQTGAAASIAEHPFGRLAELGFRVTINTDNRLMSATSMTQEMALLVEAFGYTRADLAKFTVNAMKSAFLPFDERITLIDDVIKPGYR